VSTQNDGGPAFPKTGNYADEQMAPYDSLDQVGMSLRDYFAAKALQGILASFAGVGPGDEPTIDVCAETAFRHADAMLEARKAVAS
jgi:hypothetical protein